MLLDSWRFGGRVGGCGLGEGEAAFVPVVEEAWEVRNWMRV